MTKKTGSKAKKPARAAHGTGVGAYAMKLIADGKTNDQVFAAVMKKFPESKTNLSCIGWYRNKMRRDGVKGVKANAELKKAA